MPSTKRNRSEAVGSDAKPSSTYRALLTDIKARIRVAQIKASLSVNRELIHLYWDIGELIVSRQRSQGWGKSVVERLAADLRKEFPGIAGFSPQNIWYMRSFYLAWTDEVEVLQRAVGEPDRAILQRAVGEFGGSSPPAAVAQIPWGQNIELITKLKSPLQRLWYAQHTTANGWSRPMLVHWIESDALPNLATPVGVARYTTKLVESLPAELRDSLPSPKAIEAELESQHPEAH
jgi:predicted nuclease of restriction endonuclease-like (RecB) superfamily